MKLRRSSLFLKAIEKRLLWVAPALLAVMAISLAVGQEPDSSRRRSGSQSSGSQSGEEPRPSAGAKPPAGDGPAVDSQANPKTDSGSKPSSGPKDGEAKPSERKGTEPRKTESKGISTGAKSKPVRRGPPILEARLVEGGTLNLALLDERLEFITPYGRLSVPLTDVKRLEFATRVSQEVAERVEKAIRDLAADEFEVREKASAELLELRERAYGPLAKAAEHADPEVARRAEQLLEKIREAVPEDRLAVRENDVIHTKDSKFTGKLVGDALKVLTAQFGEQRLKFADVVSLGHAAADGDSIASKNVLADPGTLQAYQAMIGQTLTFRVTAAAGSTIWGTDMYTLDSRLATAAVHAGVLKEGETGNVRVQILGAQAAFLGSTRHGVTSSEYAAYPGAYRILSSRK